MLVPRGLLGHQARLGPQDRAITRSGHRAATQGETREGRQDRRQDLPVARAQDGDGSG